MKGRKSYLTKETGGCLLQIHMVAFMGGTVLVRWTPDRAMSVLAAGGHCASCVLGKDFILTSDQ